MNMQALYYIVQPECHGILKIRSIISFQLFLFHSQIHDGDPNIIIYEWDNKKNDMFPHVPSLAEECLVKVKKMHLKMAVQEIYRSISWGHFTQLLDITYPFLTTIHAPLYHVRNTFLPVMYHLGYTYLIGSSQLCTVH